MAKIKVQNTETNQSPSRQGYITVAKKLFLDPTKFQEFLDESPKKRPKLLVDAAVDDAGTKYWVTHLPDGAANTEEISNTNCKIVEDRDENKNPNRPVSKFTLSLPEIQPVSADYLQAYVQIMYDIYKEAADEDAKGDASKAAELRKDAHRFMFGVIMLTRCR